MEFINCLYLYNFKYFAFSKVNPVDFQFSILNALFLPLYFILSILCEPSILNFHPKFV